MLLKLQFQSDFFFLLQDLTSLFPADSPYPAMITDVAVKATPAEGFTLESHALFGSNVKVCSCLDYDFKFFILAGCNDNCFQGTW